MYKTSWKDQGTPVRDKASNYLKARQTQFNISWKEWISYVNYKFPKLPGPKKAVNINQVLNGIISPCISMSLWSTVFPVYFPPHLAVLSCIHLCNHHCAALQGGLFCTIFRTHNTQMSHSLTNYLRKKNEAWLLWLKEWTIQVNSLPSSHFFAQLLEMVIGKNPNLSPSCRSMYNIAASQPALHWLKQRDVAGLSLDATSALHRGVFFHPIPSCTLYFPASLPQLQIHWGQLLEPAWGSPKHSCREYIPILFFKQGNKEIQGDKEGGRR